MGHMDFVEFAVYVGGPVVLIACITAIEFAVRRKKRPPRGFEVKLTTDRPDGPPVLEEKANDHG